MRPHAGDDRRVGAVLAGPLTDLIDDAVGAVDPSRVESLVLFAGLLVWGLYGSS